MRKINDVKQVEPGTQSGDTAPDTGRERDNGTETAAAREINTLRREMERRDLPAGPPPTFEVSQLEIEADIQQVIARVEAARSQAREADALKIEALTEERLAEGEMSRLTEAKTASLAEAKTVAVPTPDRADAGGLAPGSNTAPSSAGAPPMLDAHV